MMQPKTRQLLRELGKLSKDADANLYQRLQRAAAVLTDTDWIADFHGGKRAAACASLQHQFFLQHSGYITLARLLRIFAAFPQQADWKLYRYDARSMEILYQRQQPPRRRRAAKLVDVAKRDSQVQELSHQLKFADQVVETKDQELQRLRARVRELELENARLVGELTSLRSGRAA